MAPRDLAVAARLHRALLPHGFFAELGPRFPRAYHLSFLASPYAIGLGAYLEGRLVVQQRQDGSVASRLARWLDAEGVAELGSPWDFDRAGGRSVDHQHRAPRPHPYRLRPLIPRRSGRKANFAA